LAHSSHTGLLTIAEQGIIAVRIFKTPCTHIISLVTLQVWCTGIATVHTHITSLITTLLSIAEQTIIGAGVGSFVAAPIYTHLNSIAKPPIIALFISGAFNTSFCTVIGAFIAVFSSRTGITRVDRAGSTAAGIITITENVVIAGNRIVDITATSCKITAVIGTHIGIITKKVVWRSTTFALIAYIIFGTVIPVIARIHIICVLTHTICTGTIRTHIIISTVSIIFTGF
jgi:hypothetical protein